MTKNATLTPSDINFVPLSIASMAAKEINKSQLVSDIIAKKNHQPVATPLTIARSILNLPPKQILDSVAVPNNVNPSYYIFNYVGGGFVIIPADKRVKPVMSYSDNGYLPYSGKLPSGLIKWLSVNDKNMQRLRKDTSLKQTSGTAAFWADFTSASAAMNRSLVINRQVYQPPTCQPSTTVQTVGPLLQTAWAQGYPYNLLCPAAANPNTSYSFGFGIDPTGCVATAMAQVMYYWKYPANYNWAVMPLTSSYTGSSASNVAVAQLMRDAGTSVSMVYGDQASSPNANYNITCTMAFKAAFHYSSSAEANFNAQSYPTVISNINAGEPLLFSGDTNTDGHEWVCDGYEQVTIVTCPVGGETDLYFHMNWGWNEVGVTDVDGWYDYDLWSVYNGPVLETYQYNQAMTYNIHP